MNVRRQYLSRFISVCLVSGGILSVLGCSPQNTEHQQPNGIIYCSEGNPASFNPQLDTSGTTVDVSSHQIYDRLLDFDLITGEIVPGLASSWSTSSDGLTYTFQLRKDIAFHSTAYFTPSRSFDADDVVFSFNRWRDENHPYHEVSGGRYPYINSVGLDDLIGNIERINRYRVKVTLVRPESSFLANLATDFSIILSAEYAKQLQAVGTPELIDTQPIGTGPFKFNSFRQDRFVRFDAHTEYWRERSTTEQLIFDITPSSSLRLAKLMTGECDAMAFPTHSQLDVIRKRKELILDEKPGLNVGFWAFNTSKPPFDNPQVRRALALAIDKNAILEAIYFGSAIPAASIIPPSSWAFQPDSRNTSFNPIEATRLLRENGVEEGFSMTIWAMPVERAYNPNAMKMAELMQRYLRDVGIDANIISYEWSTFRARLNQGSHDSVLIGWSADNGDPDNFFRPLLTCAAIDSGTNRARWCSKEYDTLIDKALTYTDQEDRAYFYSKAIELISQEMPLMPIAHAFRYQAYRDDVTGIEINPYGGIQFRNVSKP
ncbi:ABC transporter substrate-binding protein [uncultured Paraglaciecola sp.]|uniref:ABC transporter substrate-binding protein n=1 Tax=uncultured Paraglaciecola sp. TaxID=1765024 RepID=UPI0030DC2C4A|tara:strand:- start:6169 stop:7803 length:1635 start_codon:yes stop_codon:yes gene_type:complete